MLSSFLSEGAKYLTLFYSKDRGSRSLWNAGNHPPHHMMYIPKSHSLNSEITSSYPARDALMLEVTAEVCNKRDICWQLSKIVSYIIQLVESRVSFTGVLNISHFRNVWNKGCRS